MIAYTPAQQKGAPGQASRNRPVYRVYLHASTAGGTQLVGMGESQHESPLDRADERGAWNALTAAGAAVVGRADAGIQDAMKWAREVTPSPRKGGTGAKARLRRAAGRVVGSGQSHDPAISAVAAAYADLVAQHQGAPREGLDDSETYTDLLPRISRHAWYPKPPAVLSPEGHSANEFDSRDYYRIPGVTAGSIVLLASAMGHGLDTLRTGRKELGIDIGQDRYLHFRGIRPESSSRIQVPYTENKQLAREYLERSGAPIPIGRAFSVNAVEDAVAYAETLGYPVVVKPLAGYGGKGVVSGITEEDGVRWAIGQLRPHQDPHDYPDGDPNDGTGGGTAARCIVEKHIEGHDYRILAAHGEVVSIVQRRPPSVTGDGMRSVAELVLEKNYLRAQNPYTRAHQITCDERTAYILGRAGMDWSSVPADGQAVKLGSAANLAQGGDSSEVLDETHPSIIEAALRGIEAIPGLQLSGVDFLIPDHRLPLDDQLGGICELNTSPELLTNQLPMFGPVQPVADRILRSVAAGRGAELGPRMQSVRVRIEADEAPTPDELLAEAVERADRLGLVLDNVSSGESRLSFEVIGLAERIAALSAGVFMTRTRAWPATVRTSTLGQCPETTKGSDAGAVGCDAALPEAGAVSPAAAHSAHRVVPADQRNGLERSGSGIDPLGVDPQTIDAVWPRPAPSLAGASSSAEGPSALAPRRPGQTSRLLEACALGMGLSTTRISGTGFTVGTQNHQAAVAFQGTLSSETSRAADHATSDRMARRALLQDRGVPVPRAVRCTGHDSAAARAALARWGGRALVKPASRAAGRVARAGVRDVESLTEAVEGWSAKLGGAAPLLLEELIEGTEIACYVLGGRAISAALVSRGRYRREIWSPQQSVSEEPGGKRSESKLTEPKGTAERLATGVVRLAEEAAAALPHMPQCTVRLVCPQGPGSAEDAVVVSIMMGPVVLPPNSTPEWSTRMATQFVDHASRSLGPQQLTSADIDVGITLTELADSQATLQALTDRLPALAITGEVGVVGDRTLQGSLHGAPGALSTLSGEIIVGALGPTAMRDGVRDPSLRPQTVRLDRAGG